jgi:cyanophycinase-like exopeptidase
MSPFKPIYALADSTLLFVRRPNGQLFLDEVARSTGVKRPSIAYIGASNGDSLELYHLLFEPAIEPAALGEARMIVRRPCPEDAKFLERADIILLAGGDVHAGWRIFEENGFKELILRRFSEGVVLIGVSAGAVQLGGGYLQPDGASLFATFGFLPFYVGAHEEKEDWASLRKIGGLSGETAEAIGIPSGGGIRYANGEVEILSQPVFHFAIRGGQTSESVIYQESHPPASLHGD